MSGARPIDWLRLARAGMLFSPAADVAAGLCLVGRPIDAEGIRAMLASVALYAAGMILNDLADRREDAVQRPERPIPSGRIAPWQALVAGAAALGACLLLTPWPLWHGGMAVLVLLYDFVLKRRPPFDALAMGTLRATNLLAGAVFATRSLPTDPVVIAAALAYGVYIVAVTVLGRFEDDRRVSARAVVAVQTVPPLVAVPVLLALPTPWPAAAIGIVAATAFALRVRRHGTDWNRAAIRGSMMWLLLGTMLYTALLCLGNGRPIEFAAIVGAAVVARRVARSIALT